jgi:hypothetical protein
MESNIYTHALGLFSTYLQKVYMQNKETARSEWTLVRLWNRLTSQKHPDSSIPVRWPLLQMLQVMTWRGSGQGNLSFGATGVLLTSTFLPDLLCFPRLKDGVICIHCILIWQEGDIECPKQLWRSEKQGGKRKKEFCHLEEFTHGSESD